MKFFPIFSVATALIVAEPICSQNLDGDWSGKLNLGLGRNLKLTFHLSSVDSVITLDSPDQGAFGIDCNIKYIDNDSINFEAPSLLLSYEGKIKAERLQGTLIQRGVKLSMYFKKDKSKVNRPQLPKPPFPYYTEDVNIENTTGGSTLAATLCIPDSVKPRTPVVVLVSGSGLQNRDAEVFGHKTFAVIADYLARNGIASIRYDDRGFGKSTGDVTNATTADFASDALAIVKWLNKQKRFGSVGMVGHSEGGQIAYLLGAKNDGPDFIVSIAGPSIKGTKTIAYQNKIAVKRSGFSSKQADDFAEAVEKTLEYALLHPDMHEITDDILNELYPQSNDDNTTRQLSGALKKSFANVHSNKWMQYFIGYDPSVNMKNLRIPALIIYGEKDTQVPPALNSEPAQKFANKAVVKIYADLNHLMQHARTGDISEYGNIEETFSTEVLSDIVAFIEEVSK